RHNLGTNNTNVGEHLQQLQKAGVQLNLTPARIQEIQQAANKQQADKKIADDKIAADKKAADEKNAKDKK
ncbi:hypothetical protein HZA45_02435, partial [Candidatus Peregrinibacteria bacterium]|nr:hypothetical protein [Candidatus Peregrinibacteria bacterium]